MTTFSTRRTILSAALACLLPMTAWADDYPSKPITIVVPFAPGGITDAVARMIGKELSTAWKQPVIVDNRAGATGMIGTNNVARADKDGHTVLFTITSHAQLPSLKAKMPYDVLKDFEPVSQIVHSTNILAVNSSWPVKSVKDLITKLKAEPEKHAYGSYGAGSTANIYGELFKKNAGVSLVHTPYKGAAPLLNDFVAGHLNVAFLDIGTAMPHIKSGKVRPLAIIGTQRSPTLPDVPTMLELGYKGYEAGAWMGMFMPAGTPKDRVNRFSTEVARILKEPAMVARLRESGLEPVGSTPAQFSTFFNKDVENWKRIVDVTGVTAE